MSPTWEVIGNQRDKAFLKFYALKIIYLITCSSDFFLKKIYVELKKQFKKSLRIELKNLRCLKEVKMNFTYIHCFEYTTKAVHNNPLRNYR